MLNNIEELIKLYDDPPADGTRSMARDPMPKKPKINKNKSKAPIKLAKDEEDLEEEFRVIEIPMIMKEYNKFKTGDKVSIIESKPFSKNKKFQVMESTK